MSYILDALKKSERERSLGHVPTLNTVHSYPKSTVGRRWLWLALALVILLMLLGVAIYGVMFWDQSGVAESGIEERQVPSAGADHVVEPQQPASAAISNRALTNAGPPMADVEAPGSTKPAITRSAMNTQTSTSYPTIDDLDDGMQQRLSNIVVNVVSYSDEPSRRFVMVNQRIYRQGQRVNGQLTVVEIRPDGAILRFEGREFLAVP